jgi:alpha-ketoglutarate-dependent taurine dioxygenase
MALSIVEIGASFGATISGVSLANLSDNAWKEIHRAYLTYAVLVFPAQSLTTEIQKSFGRRFGMLEVINGYEGALPVGNIRPDGTQIRDDADPQEYGAIKGNEGWHSDSSYMPISANASMLSAHVIPASGSATEWADMRAAYDSLPEAVRQRVSSLSAFHSIVEAQMRLGWELPEGNYGLGLANAPLRPLVKVHPETGRPALFVGRHAHRIPGLSSEESNELLDWLNDFACQPPRVLRHEWEVGDLVLWDNRCVLHRATPWNMDEPRLLIHTRTAGDPITEASATVPVTTKLLIGHAN